MKERGRGWNERKRQRNLLSPETKTLLSSDITSKSIHIKPSSPLSSSSPLRSPSPLPLDNNRMMLLKHVRRSGRKSDWNRRKRRCRRRGSRAGEQQEQEQEQVDENKQKEEKQEEEEEEEEEERQR
eukprot:201243-Hanusia_phi.AAC.1